jgi:hypothetical protein
VKVGSQSDFKHATTLQFKVICVNTSVVFFESLPLLLIERFVSPSSTNRSFAIMAIRLSVSLLVLLISPHSAFAQPAPNVVTQWAAIVQQSIHSAGAPRSAGTSEILHTMVHLAVYDAVVAIDGGYLPYGSSKHQPRQDDADVRAAVATAAYLTSRTRVAPSQYGYLDQEYASFMATLPDGISKTAGIRVGARAAAAIVKRRAGDGFDNVLLYQCSEIPPPPGEFEPDTTCPTAATSPQPVDAKVGQIDSYTFKKRSDFQPKPPVSMRSSIYTTDFNEARDYGSADSVLRTPEQTDIAFFWSENPYVHWNRNLIRLAIGQELGVLDTARLFAAVHTAVSDAIIVGFEAKYTYAFWRPRTAIPQADTDPNPDTGADPSWRPLLSVNHPEYPSGHGFWSTALVDTVAAFFGTEAVSWTLETSKIAVPRIEQTVRTYDDLGALKREIVDARIWGGLHWRFSTEAGSEIGARVASHVSKHFFRRVK